MNERKIGRRTFLQGASVAALGAAGLFDPRASRAQVAVPNSTGIELPKLKAPALACDCHHHIYDTARFPAPSPGAEPNARSRIPVAATPHRHDTRRDRNAQALCH
jgi:D-galactarolactone isomerase